MLARAADAAPPTLMGTEVPPYPSDCSVAEGAVLGSGPPYSLSYSHLICGSRELVLLKRLIERRDGKAYSVVVDEVELLIPPGQRLLGILMCSRVPEGADQVIAIGTFSKLTEREFRAYDLTYAWRFDLSAEEIQPIAPGDVSCEWENVD